jgi:hypothetical protein
MFLLQDLQASGGADAVLRIAGERPGQVSTRDLIATLTRAVPAGRGRELEGLVRVWEWGAGVRVWELEGLVYMGVGSWCVWEWGVGCSVHSVMFLF